jgi:hypothetical protein
MGGISLRSITRAASVLGAAVLVLGALTWPLLFTYSGFAGDWEHHLWLVWHQDRSIEGGHFPSLFLNTAYSVFNPIYAFYGGTLFAVTGALSLVLGGAPVQAYVIVTILGFASALGGWYWLARMAGVGRWLALVPGLVFVTSAYYVMLLYVRGDWPEFTAVSTIPLLVAAGLSVLRAERLRIGPAIALAASSILFFGSHNLTLLLGLTTLGLAALAMLALVPAARRQVSRKGVLRLAAVVMPAAMVSAWYLLPELAYQSRTRIAGEFHHAQESIRTTSFLVSFGHLFTFSRGSALSTPSPYPFALSLPVLAIAWVLVGVVVLTWGGRDRTWTRLLLICSGLAIVIGVVMTHVGILLALPHVYTSIQFSYRLENYVLLLLSAAILAALVLGRGASLRRRAWRWMALPVCVVSLGGAIQQIADYPYPGQDRYEALTSFGEVETGNNEDFQDVSAPIVAARNLPTLNVPFGAVSNGRVSLPVHVRPGTLLATNIAAGSYLVHVTGATPVGVASGTGRMVLAVDKSSAGAQGAGAPVQEETITVSTSDGLPIVLGRVLSFCGLSILLLELLALQGRWLLAHRRRLGGGRAGSRAAR